MSRFIPPYDSVIKGDEKKIVIVSHGFGSSRGCPTAETIKRVMPEAGIGVLAYDFPGHGESEPGKPELRIENCLDALETMEGIAKEKAPEAEICYFSSSFGAYITLLYLTRREHEGTKAFFRSAAVNMPEIYKDLEEQQERELRERGYTEVDHGFDQPVIVTAPMRKDFSEYDVFEMYKPGATEIRMIHGTADEVIDPEAAKRFAEKFSIDITWVQGGDHRLSIPGAEDKVMALAKEFFLG